MTGNRHNIIKAGLGRLGLLFFLPVLLAGLYSCDKVIYDYEGDCSVHYIVNFRYDYNMKWADAFAHEVECITLYVIDGNGNIVLKQTDEGSALAQDGYSMEIDVPAGTYTLLAWGGTKDKNSFVFDDGVFAEDEAVCTLACSYGADGAPYFDGELDRLYHGRIDNVVLGTEAAATYENTLSLVKDTNTVRVVLQEVNAGQLDVDSFEFTIESDDWILDWNNNPIAEENTTYYAFYTGVAEAEIETKATGVYSAAVAEFTISRLMADRETRLNVYNNETGEVTLSFNLGQLAGLLKSYYIQDMDDQEYFDREDTYDIVFFLDGDNGNRWIRSYIYINSWKVVLQTTGI